MKSDEISTITPRLKAQFESWCDIVIVGTEHEERKIQGHEINRGAPCFFSSNRGHRGPVITQRNTPLIIRTLYKDYLALKHWHLSATDGLLN